MTPRLSICVPSRNRQTHFRQTIRNLVASPRADIEFVLADNSDQGSIMEDFVAGLADPRIRFLPSTDRPLPMQDNWERTMAAASGEWICFIGDDDYVDPDVADTLAEVRRRRPDADCIGWNRMGFKWPDHRPFPGNSSMSLANVAALADRQQQLRALFCWEGAASVPTTAFSVYHGAVRRDAMECLRQRFSNRYFEHPTVDFDCAGKLLLTAREFVYLDRPFSVLGASAASNSAAVGRFSRVGEIHQTLHAEKAPVFDLPDFAFTSRLGVAASILAAQHWFRQKYAVRFEGWEENFVRALSADCAHAEDRASFDIHAEACRTALSNFEGGRYLALFQPRFVPRRHAGIFTGLRGQYLYLDERIADCPTPAAFYAIAQAILQPAADLRFDFASKAGTGLDTAA